MTMFKFWHMKEIIIYCPKCQATRSKKNERQVKEFSKSCHMGEIIVDFAYWCSRHTQFVKSLMSCHLHLVTMKK